jgi:hypothetical protein
MLMISCLGAKVLAGKHPALSNKKKANHTAEYVSETLLYFTNPIKSQSGQPTLGRVAGNAYD